MLEGGNEAWRAESRAKGEYLSVEGKAPFVRDNCAGEIDLSVEVKEGSRREGERES